MRRRRSAARLPSASTARKAVYEGLRQADPDAVWVMQGWLFLNERDYWGAPEVEALLSKVPDDRMIILDLGAEQYEVWRAQPAVARKGFIYCTLHNFGQNTGLGGDLQGMADKQFAALKDATGSAKLLGFGLTPEGIDQNPVVYELMTDAMWRSEPIKIAEWLDEYWHARYGRQDWYRGSVGGPPGAFAARNAWDSLVESLYARNSAWYHDAWRSRPGNGKRGRPLKQMQALERALGMMLDARAWSQNNPLYQRDLVDVCKTWLGGLADRQALIASDLLDPSDHSTEVEQKYLAAKARFLATLADIDAVMATRPEHRLSTWIAQARSWGRNAAERKLMEQNARMQITAWDGRGVLTDYANKEWAGLTLDFLKKRWDIYFDSAEDEKRQVRYSTTPQYLLFENQWVQSTKPPVESPPGDPYEVVQRVYAKHHGTLEALEAEAGPPEPPGNLARLGKATDSGGTEGSGTPDKAIDGDLETYWAASPSPRWWQLDLGSLKPIRTIQVFPYWGDSRYYQYTVETSLDGKTWSRAVDMSDNRANASGKGYKHVLPAAIQARFVRINMLKNSANVGVHLVEVRLYDH